MEDIDFRAARGLDKQVVRSLINDSDWVRRHQHIFLVGPTGIGKTFLAKIHRVLCHCRTAISGTGAGAGGWQLRQAATRAGAGGCADRR
jgi:sigma54-dependent transcription regulator